jgi:RNA polymerase sigma factor (sigma-70 family)
VRRIAIRIARRVEAHDGASVEELVRAGSVGLFEALSARAPLGDTDAYATHRARAAMLDFLDERARTIRPVQHRAHRIKLAIAMLYGRLGRAPLREELTTALDLTPAQYKNTLGAIAQAGILRLDLVDFDDHDATGSASHEGDLVDAIARAIEALPEDLKPPLVLRYQADCDLLEIAAILDLPPVEVREQLAEAMLYLRGALLHI